MSVLSLGFVAGPSSPALRERLTEDSTNCGAKRPLSFFNPLTCGGVANCAVRADCSGGGESDRGDGLGVGSATGPPGPPPPSLRNCTNVVSIGTGANRRRGCSAFVGVAIDLIAGVLYRVDDLIHPTNSQCWTSLRRSDVVAIGSVVHSGMQLRPWAEVMSTTPGQSRLCTIKY